MPYPWAKVLPLASILARRGRGGTAAAGVRISRPATPACRALASRLTEAGTAGLY